MSRSPCGWEACHEQPECTAPHYYKSSQQSFEIADKEYELLQEETMPFESIFSGDDPGTDPETNMQQQEGGMTLGYLT